MQEEAEKYVITAKQLKALRNTKGVTQFQLADDIKVARNTVGSWEKPGGEVTKYSDVLAICRYFNIPLPGTEEIPPNFDDEDKTPIERIIQHGKEVVTTFFNPDNVQQITLEHTIAASQYQQSLEKLLELMKQQQKGDDTKKP